jgi:hypothetical protein
MFTLRLIGRAIVLAHHGAMAAGALYACFFTAMVVLVAAWEALS